MTNAVRGALWSVVYVLAVVGPLFFMLVADTLPGRGWWLDLSTALGFIGMSMLGLQFAVTARFNPVDAPYGFDAVLQYHRQISLVAFAFVLAHPTILMVEDPARLSLLNPITAPAPVRWGLAALLLLGVLIALSVWRLPLRLPYEVWRITHGLLAVAVVVAALVHIESVGYYVSGPWRRGLWVAVAIALVGLLVYVRIVKPVLLLRRPYAVEAVARIPGQTWHLWLRPEGHGGLRFSPGQFAWVTVGLPPFGVREHPFSFSSSAEDPGRLRFTIKELGDFTSRIGEIEPGTRAYVDGPYGAFSYERNEASGFVFLAGGIGITPIMGMLHTLADRGDRRPMVLVYANPTWEEVAFLDELDELEGRLDLRVVHVLEEPPEGWEGERGLVTSDVLDRHLPDRERLMEYFVCGPEPMMDAVERALHDRGISPDRVNLERFDFI